VISLMNIPFTTKAPTCTTESNMMTLTAATPFLLFSKTLKEQTSEKVESDLLLSQKFLDPSDLTSYNEITKRKTVKHVTEFLPKRVYCSRIAIMNASETSYEVQLCTEIPSGALPLNSFDYSTTQEVCIGGLSAEVVMFYFYFPQIGNFSTFQATATIDGLLTGTTNGLADIKVLPKLSKPNEVSITDMIKSGSKAEILKFLVERNIHNPNVFNPADILWMFIDDGPFWEDCMRILIHRNYYNDDIWSFVLKWGNKSWLKEIVRYFKIRHGLFNYMFHNIPYFKSKFVEVNNFALKDYNPLINPRAHEVGASNSVQVLNQSLNKQYREV
jgi:hypothetical protein